ncbi:putative halogenase [Gymnopus androsaceus JB14]|uniref:Halogenase n=1 Tax=Gymnopus androsaceus JB14 TaxID=1447944 RepID=A0A6A4ILL8_9AGAR|nr:putative halogenase [Gymnopus androsaceus JB14]
MTIPNSNQDVDRPLPPKASAFLLHIDVLIIGGGPAGSYAASILSREGIDVAVLEAAKFPSLIPSVRPYLRFIGAEEKMVKYGFTRKPGSAIKFNQFKREGYTDFVALGANNNAWNVIRSEFDQLLLNHAQECGAKVYEETKVTNVNFDPLEPQKPVSVSWSRTAGSSNSMPTKTSGSTTFTHLIDASGRAGLLSAKYLKNRHFNASLKNIAVWGYWSGLEGKKIGTYGKGTSREGAPWFEALIDESGWAWAIPLHNGKTSVGIVMNQERYNTRSKSQSTDMPHEHGSSLVHRYLANLNLAPGVVNLLSGKDIGLSDESDGNVQRGNIQAMLEPGSVRSASDFSYSAPSYAGGGYRIIGDAGAFIDPFFSSGIHLAFTGALSAAATICASHRRDCSEAESAAWHTKRVAVSYTRFQVVVLSAYKQMRAQSSEVLSDVDEDNFDRAFTFLRPVIQGASDMGSRLSESELQRSLDFCVNLFNPTSPEEHQESSRRAHGCDEASGGSKDIGGRILRVGCCARDAGSSDSDSDSMPKMVLDKINARRLVHSEYVINNLEAEELGGYVVRLEKGRLGLVKVEV